MSKALVKPIQNRPKTLTVHFDEEGGMTKKEELLPEIRTLDVNLSDVGYIQKDINMIVLPFFWFCRKTNYNIINYYFDHDKTKKMVVTSATGDTIPTAFDYEIIQILLKFKQAMSLKGKLKKDIFVCTAWDIAKELGQLSKNKRGYSGLSKEKKERIIKSIERLKTTSYNLQNIYNVKSTSEDGFNTYARQEKVLFNILDRVSITSDLFDSEATFNIKFNDLFLESIESKYHFSYELAKLEAITKTSAKRFFEIIDFRRHKRLVSSFKYKEIAGLIPLNSGRRNRIYINDYLKHLKRVGVIADYKTDTPPNKFTVDFLKETKQRKDRLELDYLHTDTAPQITEIEPIPSYLNDGATVANEMLSPLDFQKDYSFIESALEQHKHEAYQAEVVVLYDGSGQSEDVFISNLLYALRNYRKDGSFLAYLKGAVADDWGKEDRLKKLLEANRIKEQEDRAQKIKKEQQEKIDQETAEDNNARALLDRLLPEQLKKIESMAAESPTVFKFAKGSRLKEIALQDEMIRLVKEENIKEQSHELKDTIPA